MTFAFVNSTRKWGGVKTWTLDFGAALRDRGHRIVVVPRAGTPFVEACRSEGFWVFPVSFGPKSNPVAIFRLVRLFRRESPRVVVVNISRDLDVGAVAARLCAIPVIHRVGLVEDFRGTLRERIRHQLLVDHVLVPGRAMRDELLRRCSWLEPGEITAVPNSKPLGAFSPALGSDSKDVVFGMASQLSPSKGHRDVLRALAKLSGVETRVRLRVAGTGALGGELQEEARRLGVADRVEFVGFQRDVPGFLRELDAFLLASHKEGFPNAVLEALCAGLPVVATELEGVREMAEGAAVLVPPGDPEALARAMTLVATNPEERKRLGKEARARAEERYDVRRNSIIVERLFESVGER